MVIVHITKILSMFVAKAGNTIVMTVDHFDMVIMLSLAFGAT